MKILPAYPPVGFMPYQLLVENTTDQSRLINAFSAYRELLARSSPTSELGAITNLLVMLRQQG